MNRKSLCAVLRPFEKLTGQAHDGLCVQIRELHETGGNHVFTINLTT